MLPGQPIKLSDLDKNHMKRRGLLNKHFCKKYSNIPNETAEIANFHFSHIKTMETIRCHSKQSSYPSETKIYSFSPPIDAIYGIWKEFASQLEVVRKC